MNDYKFLLKSDLPECSKACIKCDVSCPINDCRQWIDYEEDHNCTAIAVKKNGSMSLREIADRMRVSFVRIKQIEDKALIKLRKSLAKEFGLRGDALYKFFMTAYNGIDYWASGKNRKDRPGHRGKKRK